MNYANVAYNSLPCKIASATLTIETNSKWRDCRPRELHGDELCAHSRPSCDYHPISTVFADNHSTQTHCNHRAVKLGQAKKHHINDFTVQHIMAW